MYEQIYRNSKIKTIFIKLEENIMADFSVNIARIPDGGFRRKWQNGDSAVDPLITGYMFTKWLLLPNHVETLIQSVGEILEQTCLSVTLPAGTINRAEFNGLGNQRFSVPTNVDWDNTITCRYLEFSGTPILKIFRGWVDSIRTITTGMSSLSNYTKSNYSGTMAYFATSADGSLETAVCGTGMFPLKSPRDQYGFDLTAIDKLEIDIDFNVDTLWEDDWVADLYASEIGVVPLDGEKDSGKL
jgi:hypothetical protein